ncbi:hypothetical protein K0M31_019300 [Melipona bicolor]|uniref:Uncharacterized protein n=1 Tax=Melipona bicolor TaxID=60889 RepID=A0AA40KQZ6_9HYME|nr:hypothetical protein K0M31_019300 [Melipona bicolor]
MLARCFGDRRIIEVFREDTKVLREWSIRKKRELPELASANQFGAGLTTTGAKSWLFHGPRLKLQAILRKLMDNIFLFFLFLKRFTKFGAREDEVESETNENWLAVNEKRRAGYVEDNEKKIMAMREENVCVFIYAASRSRAGPVGP